MVWQKTKLIHHPLSSIPFYFPTQLAWNMGRKNVCDVSNTHPSHPNHTTNMYIKLLLFVYHTVSTKKTTFAIWQVFSTYEVLPHGFIDKSKKEWPRVSLVRNHYRKVPSLIILHPSGTLVNLLVKARHQATINPEMLPKIPHYSTHSSLIKMRCHLLHSWHLASLATS